LRNDEVVLGSSADFPGTKEPDVKAGIISLGTRADATTFEKGCKALGFDVPLPIKKPAPSMQELKDFFVRKVDWLFLAGHSGGNNILNESGSVNITFESKRIVLTVNEETVNLGKGTANLSVDSSVKLIFFGGCSMLNKRAHIISFRDLFNKCPLLGFKQSTGWKMVDAMFGGGFIKEHFFKRAKGQLDNKDKLARIWLETAASKYAYANTENEKRFASVDTKGRRWIIRAGKIISDIKV
jgi:hypothetical protein